MQISASIPLLCCSESVAAGVVPKGTASIVAAQRWVLLQTHLLQLVFVWDVSAQLPTTLMRLSVKQTVLLLVVSKVLVLCFLRQAVTLA